MVNKKTVAILLVLGIALSVLVVYVNMNRPMVLQPAKLATPQQDKVAGDVSFEVLPKKVVPASVQFTGATVGFTVVKQKAKKVQNKEGETQ